MLGLKEEQEEQDRTAKRSELVDNLAEYLKVPGST